MSIKYVINNKIMIKICMRARYAPSQEALLMFGNIYIYIYYVILDAPIYKREQTEKLTNIAFS